MAKYSVAAAVASSSVQKASADSVTNAKRQMYAEKLDRKFGSEPSTVVDK